MLIPFNFKLLLANMAYGTKDAPYLPQYKVLNRKAIFSVTLRFAVAVCGCGCGCGSIYLPHIGVWSALKFCLATGTQPKYNFGTWIVLIYCSQGGSFCISKPTLPCY